MENKQRKKINDKILSIIDKNGSTIHPQYVMTKLVEFLNDKQAEKFLEKLKDAKKTKVIDLTTEVKKMNKNKKNNRTKKKEEPDIFKKYEAYEAVRNQKSFFTR